MVLVGDLNSDDDTVAGADHLAYKTLLAAGMVERSTDDPLSCCLNSSLLAVGAGGSVADFDHQVDHVMTRDPDDGQAEELVGDRAVSRSTASGTPTTRACSAP